MATGLPPQISNYGYLLAGNRGRQLGIDPLGSPIANYNVRNWWRLGVAAFVEDKFGDDAGPDPVPLFPNGHQSLGFQIDTTFKF
jgi:hypothetical protein